MKIMKIVVPVVVEIDPSEWNAVYGCGNSATEVREDVKTYILNQVQQSPGMLESSANVTIK